jgi:hypothetical protein
MDVGRFAVKVGVNDKVGEGAVAKGDDIDVIAADGGVEGAESDVVDWTVQEDRGRFPHTAGGEDGVMMYS